MKTIYKQNPSKKALFLVVGITLAIVLCLSIYAVVTNSTTFTTGNNQENLTLAGGLNSTLYIDIPMYGYIQNVTIYAEGIIS